jgi:hypothetical protein
VFEYPKIGLSDGNKSPLMYEFIFSGDKWWLRRNPRITQGQILHCIRHRVIYEFIGFKNVIAGNIGIVKFRRNVLSRCLGYPEDGSSMFIRKIGTYLSVYMIL